jgi:hypothetical protein
MLARGGISIGTQSCWLFKLPKTDPSIEITGRDRAKTRGWARGIESAKVRLLDPIKTIHQIDYIGYERQAPEHKQLPDRSKDKESH